MAVTPGYDTVGTYSNAFESPQAIGGGPNDFTTALNPTMGLKVPLGSQLNLLSAQNKGNQFLKYDRLQNQKLGSLQNVLTGYNTLTGVPGAGYFAMSSAYGRF